MKDEQFNLIQKEIADLQIVIKDIGQRLHDLDGRIYRLEQLAPTREDLPY